MFLLDTDVVSLLRRPDRHPAPAKWLRTQRPDDVFISVVTLAELERGLAQQRRRDPEFARDLADWIEQTTASFGDRIIAVDSAAARLWGRMSVEMGHFNVDLLIAATALVHGLIVVTRNVRHFEPAGVRVLNAFEDDGDSEMPGEGG
jgi:predicted nucleic acid-binding protein